MKSILVMLALLFETFAACGGTTVDANDAGDAATNQIKDAAATVVDCPATRGCVAGAPGRACSDGVIRPISCTGGHPKCMMGWIPIEECGCGHFLPDGGVLMPGGPCL